MNKPTAAERRKAQAAKRREAEDRRLIRLIPKPGKRPIGKVDLSTRYGCSLGSLGVRIDRLRDRDDLPGVLLSDPTTGDYWFSHVINEINAFINWRGTYDLTSARRQRNAMAIYLRYAPDSDKPGVRRLIRDYDRLLEDLADIRAA